MNKKTKKNVVINWDFRRQLAQDICTLAPCDLAGVYLRVRAAERQPFRQEPLVSTSSMVDLDAMDDLLLRELRVYVDACLRPQLPPMNECQICLGLWACGPVVSCANEHCGTSVHEECFGVLVRDAPKGKWLCPTCSFGKQLTCVICFQHGGAIKPTTETGKWVHALCALVVPETTLRDVPTLEPVDGIQDVPGGRFRYMCAVCRQKGGACVVCEAENCNVGFHPMCAADAGLLIGNANNPFGVYCSKHIPHDYVPGAKRWVSEVDCVPEFAEKFYEFEEAREEDNYSFYLESSDYLLKKSKDVTVRNAKILDSIDLKSNFAISPSFYKDKRIKTYNNMFHVKAMSVPIIPNRFSLNKVPRVSSTVSLVEKPTDIELPLFPSQTKLIGAIVEVYQKKTWWRAEILEYCSSNRKYLLKYLKSSKGCTHWFKITPRNTKVFYLCPEPSTNTKITIKLSRVQGNSWTTQPKQFALTNP